VFIGWGDACDSTKVYFRFSGGKTNHEESNYSWVGPLLDQEYFVGEVNVCMLKVVAKLPNNLKRYKVSQISNTKSWQYLERLLHNASVTSHHHGKPMEWVWGETNTILP
jgi:hypothetical protein